MHESYAQQAEREMWDAIASSEREAAAVSRERAAESWERSDTDGFVSQWAHGVMGGVHDLAARIADNGGVWTFTGLFDSVSGKRVDARLVSTKYGKTWCVRRSDGSVAHWVSAYKSGPRSKLAKLGLVERDETAKAKADTWAPPGARGLSGATSVQVIAKRLDGGIPEGAVPWDKLPPRR